MRTLPPLAPQTGARSAVTVAVLVLLLAACDAADPAAPPPGGPDPIAPLPADQQALVAQAFEEVEELFALGFQDDGRAAARTAGVDLGTATAAMAMLVDTTTYTGVYDATNGKGYLVTLQYRQPQGVGVWTARVQHARAVDHDDDPTTAALGAVESVTLSFIAYADLEAFMSDLDAGAIAYLVGSSSDAEAAFNAFDTWRVSQVYSPGLGQAVVTYANAELRESVAVRDPVVTLGANGTGTVRDGGPAGEVRTRYYGADFAIAADGTVSGTLLRTLLSSGDPADGAVISRSDYPGGSFRQTRQRGGDGVVVRENTQG
jgi:hypothetical protein